MILAWESPWSHLFSYQREEFFGKGGHCRSNPLGPRETWLQLLHTALGYASAQTHQFLVPHHRAMLYLGNLKQDLLPLCTSGFFFIYKVIHNCIHFLGLAYGCSINILMHLILRTVPNMASTCVNYHKKGTQTCGDYFILFRRQHGSRNEFLDKMPSLFCSLYPRLARFWLI